MSFQAAHAWQCSVDSAWLFPSAQLAAQVLVVGVESTAANAMVQSLAEGQHRQAELTAGSCVLQVLVVGVESTAANAMAQSLAEGQRITLSKVDAFADGTAVKQVHSHLQHVLCCSQQIDS